MLQKWGSLTFVNILLLYGSNASSWSRVRKSDSANVIMESDCDYSNGDIGSQSCVTNDENCVELCSKFPDCSYVSWNTYQAGTCWYKSSTATKKLNANDVSCSSGKITPATPTTIPAPTPTVVTDLNWWQDEYITMRTFSPKCSGSLTLQQIMSDGYLDKLQASGIQIINLNAAYDSGTGYNYGDLWCGLLLNNLNSLDPSLGSNDDWDTFVKNIHDRGMKIMTWLNPSYIYYNSDMYVAAAQDMSNAGGNIANLPSGSKAYNFIWDTDKYNSRDCKSKEVVGELTAYWVCDDNAKSAYYSVWGRQPAANFLEPAYQEYVRDALVYWIDDMNIDGFLFDAPSFYVGIGDQPNPYGQTVFNPQILKSMTKGLKTKRSLSEIAFMAELYGYEDSLHQTPEYGLDVCLGDTSSVWNLNGLGYMIQALMEAIQSMNPGNLEPDFFHADYGMDQAKQMYFYSGFLNIIGEYQTVPTNYNGHTYSADEMRLVLAVMATSGYVPAVQINSNNQWWVAFNVNGLDNDNTTKLLLDAISESSEFSRVNNVRYPLDTNEWETLAFMSHNSATGSAAIAVFNFATYEVTSTISMSAFGTAFKISSIPNSLTDLITGTKITVNKSSNTITINLPARGYALFPGFTLQKWDLALTIPGEVHHDCRGSSNEIQSFGEVHFANCFHNCYSDDNCDAFTVEWLSDKQISCTTLSETNYSSECKVVSSYSTYKAV